MFHKPLIWPIILAFLLISIGLVVFVLAKIPADTPEPVATETPSPTPTEEPTTGEPPLATTQTFDSQSLAAANDAFTFTTTIPVDWVAEAIPEIEAINLYDPAAPGDTNLEKSQVFIRYFRANTFLTLSTVTIHTQSDRTLNGRPARTYEIEKLSSVADFAHQPSWRNDRHTVTDIRAIDASPSIFYVLARRPDLDSSVYETFLTSFDTTPNPGLADPINDWQNRITKKPFGLYAEPGNSPVDPEHFTGYHTAVDVEYEDSLDDIPVYAITDGEVVVARTASGYGGVVLVKHTLNNETIYGVYGHLDPAQLPAVGAQVRRGDQLGILGEGYTAETDTERKHLHFGLRREPLAIAGYVQSESELVDWYDPTIFYN